MPPQNRKPVKASFLLNRLREDVRSLNSSILVITQKMKYVVRNEKILGRNLIVLNKKLNGLEEKLSPGQAGGNGAGSQQVQEILQALEETNQKVAELSARVQQLSEETASKEELQEMHYVVDSINPLQFVTLEQAKDLLSSSPKRKKAKGK